MSDLDLTGVAWVRLVFVDVFGGTHSIQLPAARFDEANRSGVPFDGSALQGPTRQLEEDMLLVPDPATLVATGGGLARVACTAMGLDRQPWPGDPRAALARVVDEVDDLASDWIAAAELEFYVLDPAGLPVDQGGYFSEVEGVGMAVVRTAAERLCALGVDVLTCHHEAGPGQYELDLAPLGPMALADGLVLAKQIIRETATELGAGATFMARPFSDEPGSGLHLHQEVRGRLVAAHGLDEEGSSVVAGLLAHAPALTALAAPSVNSYKRLHAGPEAPGSIMWAHTNRAALVRVGASGTHHPAIEFRAADPSANPYLLIAGLLVAAAHGIEAGLEVPPPFEEDVAGFDPAARTVRYQPLPRDLDGALDALLADDVLVDAFDSRLLTRLVDGRRAEAEAYRSQVTPWELARYLDEA